ncbi:MAG: MBL fold metallo-hydrolase, partial [Deltaproteobacteria bacterium]|nr:MBL fold metallo-hydrolase [Deltaproteobacteria bacterium]
TVVGVPGKSPGEVALHWPERRILIVGDAVVGDPPGRCKLLPEKVVDDPARLRESVRSLLALDFDILLPGDGAPIPQGAKARLRELVNTFPK